MSENKVSKEKASDEMVQNYDNQYDHDDMSETCMYFCNDCQLPIELKRKDPVFCTNPRKNHPNETCYRTDLMKLSRMGWTFRVAR
jgi:hypothetical protein